MYDKEKEDLDKKRRAKAWCFENNVTIDQIQQAWVNAYNADNAIVKNLVKYGKQWWFLADHLLAQLIDQYAYPQKIAICTDWCFYSALSSSRLMQKICQEISGKKWYKIHREEEELIRISPRFHEFLESRNFKLAASRIEKCHFKIVEIPANVNWGVRDCECASGEYIYEKHRTWS